MHIWVDADACPAVIKDILFRAAQRWQLPLTLVANQMLYTPPSPLIRAVQLRDIRMVRLLLDAGANADKADTLAGMSARDYAKRDARGSAVLRAIEDAKKPKAATVGPK